MPYLTSQNIWRALVATLRANATLRAALIGGIHEELAPEAVDYPHAVWTAVVPGVMEDSPGLSPTTVPAPRARTYIALADVVVVSRNSVEASNLDQSVTETLDGASLAVTGQTTLICHRVGDIRSTDSDREGKKVYRVGGSYEIWTHQHALPPYE